MPPFTKAQAHQYLEGLRAALDRAQVISQRGNRMVIRWRAAGSGESMVVKLWSRPDLRGGLRRLLRIAPSDREWKNLVRLSQFGVAVPRPLGFSRVAPSIAGYTDVLFMEDLGECETATEHLKRLIRAGDELEALRFEDAVIEITRQLLEAGMLDEDHGMHNIIVQSSGRAVRLDLEVTRRVFFPRLFPSLYGRMLGRLIGMHAFAVQPDVAWTRRFAQRLRDRLEPPRIVLSRAAVHARGMLAHQSSNIGIDTMLDLPWN